MKPSARLSRTLRPLQYGRLIYPLLAGVMFLQLQDPTTGYPTQLSLGAESYSPPVAVYNYTTNTTTFYDCSRLTNTCITSPQTPPPIDVLQPYLYQSHP